MNSDKKELLYCQDRLMISPLFNRSIANNTRLIKAKALSYFIARSLCILISFKVRASPTHLPEYISAISLQPILPIFVSYDRTP